MRWYLIISGNHPTNNVFKIEDISFISNKNDFQVTPFPTLSIHKAGVISIMPAHTRRAVLSGMQLLQ